MKLINDPHILHHIWLCAIGLVVASLPCASASKLKAAAIDAEHHGRLEALLGSTAVSRGTGAETRPEQALRGRGGGYDVLDAQRDGQDVHRMEDVHQLEDVHHMINHMDDVQWQGGDVYRPWKTRFDLQPFDPESAKYEQPENRMSYRRFYTANPHLAGAPNSRDREVQSTVVMVFGLTALGSVIAAILIVDQLQVLGADELSSLRYQHKMLKVVIYAAVPWLLLGGWLLNIFIVFVGSPMRYPSTGCHWQCGAMTWFILLAPIINLFYFSAHALWISKLSFSVEKHAPMGRMFSDMTSDMQEGGNDGLTRIFNFASHSVTRLVLLLLEVASAAFGYFLVTFRYGSNSQFCQPEVYWTTTALVAMVTIIIVFTALAFVCSVLIRAFSVSGWVQDFAESFRGGPLSTKEEEIWVTSDDKESVITEDPNVNDWNETWEEDNQRHQDILRHDEIMQEHAAYREAVSEEPPARAQSVPQFEEDGTAASHDFEEDGDDEPLIVWPDSGRSIQQVPQAIPTSFVGAPVVSRTIMQPTSSRVNYGPGIMQLPSSRVNCGPGFTMGSAALLGASMAPGAAYQMAPQATLAANQQQVFGAAQRGAGEAEYEDVEEEEQSWQEWLMGQEEETTEPLGAFIASGMVPPSGKMPPSMAPSGFIAGPPGTMPPGSFAAGRPPPPGTMPLSSFQQPQPVLSGNLPYGYNSMYAAGRPSITAGTPPGSGRMTPPSHATLGPSSFRQLHM